MLWSRYRVVASAILTAYWTKMAMLRDRQKFPYISYKRLKGLTKVFTISPALFFIFFFMSMLSLNANNWTDWQKLGSVIGWSVGLWVYLWLATTARAHEAADKAAR
jgi:hypothetical protein